MQKLPTLSVTRGRLIKLFGKSLMKSAINFMWSNMKVQKNREGSHIQPLAL